ncbi:hypothetical protein LP422_18205 [Janibacter limosus]|uniref:Uncharacterized protein n=1 Tax=Janibacter limosus TaxID=53458 RepID=A0AC61U8Y2_9MICO|nr:hypothetical protein [Janibacter limosus]UUZ46414.1 hypothetical protein LP422_18205 [Janibacter limosus]
MRRCAEVTGCDVSVPRQAALALAALEWSGIGSDTGGRPCAGERGPPLPVDPNARARRPAVTDAGAQRKAE